MRNESPTAPQIVDDIGHTRRDADAKSKVDGLSFGQVSSARQFIATRLKILNNRLRVLDTRCSTKGSSPDNPRLIRREIERESDFLNRSKILLNTQSESLSHGE